MRKRGMKIKPGCTRKQDSKQNKSKTGSTVKSGENQPVGSILFLQKGKHELQPCKPCIYVGKVLVYIKKKRAKLVTVHHFVRSFQFIRGFFSTLISSQPTRQTEVDGNESRNEGRKGRRKYPGHVQFSSGFLFDLFVFGFFFFFFLPSEQK